MKKLTAFLLFALCFFLCYQSRAQRIVNDKSIRYQEERMVFKQWDKNKFTPTSGFLGLNPYYWLTWGLFYPNYHKTDLRPLSPSGPQTQRLALVGAMSNTDDHYKQQSDTVRNTALAQIANNSGTVSAVDPLWMLYYSNEFKPVLSSSPVTILSGLSPQVSAKVMSDGTYDWYKKELDRLKERVQGARTADMERGSRILAYYRLLNEYHNIAGVWAIKTSTAQATLNMTAQQQKSSTKQIPATNWTPQTDIQIANKILLRVQ